MKWYEINTSDEAIESLDELAGRLRNGLFIWSIIALSVSGVIIGITSLIEGRPPPLWTENFIIQQLF